MSELPQEAVPSLAREAPRKRRAQRWTDTAAVLLTCVSVAAVIAAAMPALLRAAGLGAPPEDTSRHDADRLKLPTPPPGAAGNPIFAPDDEDDEEGDEPHLTQLEREYPEGLWPGRRSAEDRAREREIFGAPPGGAASAKTGRALGPLKLFKDPLPGAGVVAIVARGTALQIVHEVGDWVFIKYRGGGEPVTGWVQKSEISVR
jgi:Bacterial SH3 domain